MVSVIRTCSLKRPRGSYGWIATIVPVVSDEVLGHRSSAAGAAWSPIGGPRRPGAASIDWRDQAVERDPRMTEHEHDRRAIDPTAPQYNARLVRRVDQTGDLGYFWVRFDDQPTSFEPGQYMTIGVFTDGKLVQRPYSVASPPAFAGGEGYEFYVRLVPILRFTSLLWRLPVGHAMRMIVPKGKFLLEPDDRRNHLFVSTGTV